MFPPPMHTAMDTDSATEAEHAPLPVADTLTSEESTVPLENSPFPEVLDADKPGPILALTEDENTDKKVSEPRNTDFNDLRLEEQAPGKDKRSESPTKSISQENEEDPAGLSKSKESKEKMALEVLEDSPEENEAANHSEKQLLLSAPSPTAFTDAIDLLLRLSSPCVLGEQFRLSKRFLCTSLDEALPQLIALIARQPRGGVPFYAGLRHKAGGCLAFRLRLFFALKSALCVSPEEVATRCYFLCSSLFEASIRALRRNCGVLKHNYSRHHAVWATVRYDRAVFTLPRRILTDSVWAVQEDAPSTEMRAEKRTSSARPLRRRILRTVAASPRRRCILSFDGLFIAFVQAVSGLTLPDTAQALNPYLAALAPYKVFKTLTGTAGSPSPFRRAIHFFEALSAISLRLKRLPTHLRQRALETELELLSMQLRHPVRDPIHNGRVIAHIQVEECTTLDSAENAPYLLIVELIDRAVPLERKRSSRYARAAALGSHLNAVNDLGDAGDVNSIRDNILVALEQQLFISKRNEARSAPTQEGDTSESGVEKAETAEMSASLSILRSRSDALLIPARRVWAGLEARVAAASPLAQCPGWQLAGYIVKTGMALRLEYLASQIISELASAFQAASLPLYLCEYKIYLISEAAGLVEAVPETLSVHKIKSEFKTLSEYYARCFTDEAAARRNFLHAFAGYSVASYVLLLKDRHNGNILIDGSGRLIHVDFGFILGRHPGFYGVENAPFKYADEYGELVDQEEFCRLLTAGLSAAAGRVERLCGLVAAVEGRGVDAGAAAGLRERLASAASAEGAAALARQLVERSAKNVRTAVYDRFQYFSNGYY